MLTGGLATFDEFVGEVRSGAYPEERHTYSMPEEELALFEADDLDQGRR